MTAEKETTWSPQDTRLIELLAAGLSQAEAAAKVKLSPETVCRRWANLKFRKAVRTLVAQRMEAGSRVLITHYTAAVETLAELLKDESPHIRHKAAESILRHSTAAGELDVLHGCCTSAGKPCRRTLSALS